MLTGIPDMESDQLRVKGNVLAGQQCGLSAYVLVSAQFVREAGKSVAGARGSALPPQLQLAGSNQWRKNWKRDGWKEIFTARLLLKLPGP